MADKIYFNSITAKQGQYGIKLSGKVDKIIEELKKNENESGFINLDLNPRQAVGKYGETHSLTVNTWKPNGAKPQQPQQPVRQETVSNEVADDLPF